MDSSHDVPSPKDLSPCVHVCLLLCLVPPNYLLSSTLEILHAAFIQILQFKAFTDRHLDLLSRHLNAIPAVSTYKRFNCKTFSKSHTCFLLSLSLSFSLPLSLLLSLSLSFSLSCSLDLSLSLSLSPLPVLDSFLFPSLIKVMETKNITNNLKQLQGHQVFFLMQ